SLDIPRTSLLRKTLRLQTWRRALTGRLKWQHVAAAARLPRQGASLPTARDYDDPSQGLPHNLGDLVRRLCARDVYILMVCADGDDSLSVMRTRHGATLRDAQDNPRFTFATVEADSHVFSTDDAAAGLLNETISAWIENVFLPATARVRGAA